MTPFEMKIVEISKLSLKTGDILALRVDKRIADAELREIYIQLERLVPIGVKIAVVPNTAEFQVVTPS